LSLRRRTRARPEGAMRGAGERRVQRVQRGELMLGYFLPS
jgi:hypothetical protein